MNRGTLVLCLAASISAFGMTAHAQPTATTGRCFELRTYYTHPGRLAALNARFRDHTIKLFKKHGIEVVGFWVPIDKDAGAGEKLVYLLAHKSREAAEASWKAFGADPEWTAVKTASEADGPIVAKVEKVYLAPTDYSALK